MLYIVRGLPGSGKSTYARTLKCFHIEADMVFIQNDEYKFDPNKLKLAHQWCQDMCLRAMRNNLDIVVSNTFTTKKEMEPYLYMAKNMGYKVKVIRMTGNYGNVHNVPESVLENMRNRMEPFEGEVLAP